jgi:C-terminal processing protease CtpA/Prc
MKKLLFFLFSIFLMSSCTKEDFGITSIDNPYSDVPVSVYGETITISFVADAAWDAEIVLHPEGDWAKITQKRGNDKAGTGRVQIKFSANQSVDQRTADLYVAVSGKDRMLVASLCQASAGNSSPLSAHLNEYMHNILKKDYLWAEEYAGLDVDMSLPYNEFLQAHLLSLESNIEDGGVYRSNMGGNSGKRYIYSSIQEVTSGTKAAVQNMGLGFGPMIASVMPWNGYGLSIGYVHEGSPAYKAGMKRGDTVYEINGKQLSSEDDCNRYHTELYQSPSGTYTLKFFRDADIETEYTATVSVSDYDYNPVLYKAVLGGGSHRIGYVVLENFDYYSQDAVESMISELASDQITDLILDLRFNQGGSVAQSRYLCSAIAGTSNLDKVFANLTYNDGTTDKWLFRGGPSDQDGLGIARDLGLDRLFVITSYGTASASELVITSLRGIDFPVYTIGGTTEGKNVGMTTSVTEYKGRQFQFSPITFRLTNAKGFGDYADGIEPDLVLDTQNATNEGDIDNMFPYSFGDWSSFHFNTALASAYASITGTQPVSAQTKCASVANPAQFTPIGEPGPWLHQPNRYGNLVY